MSSTAEQLDLDQVDGPHSPERTARVARLLPEAVRFLNYASLPASRAPGISYPGDVDDVLGSIAAAAGGLQQTLAQLAQCLQTDLATGSLRLDRGRPYADDPAKAVEVACAELETAIGTCGQLRAVLGAARRVTSAMYLDVDEDDSNGR